MRSLRYRVVDVFTDVAFAGNPLAVVLDSEGLTTAQMQALALEFHLSETVFPLPPPEGADYALRIFTPTDELPFAGHPSVGAAWVLHDLGRLPAGDVVQSCGAGLLPVSVDSSGAQLTGGTPVVGEPLDPAAVAAAVGLAADDLVAVPRSAGVGISFTFAVVRPGALARSAPVLPAMEALGGSGVSVTEWSPPSGGSQQVAVLTGPSGRASTRVFPGPVGVLEDPATGSAALGFGVYLAAAGLLGDGAHDYVVEQGVQMGRRSVLTCTVEVRRGAAVRTTVRGGVVPVASGEVLVPQL